MESEVRRTGNGELLNLKSEKNGTEFDMYKGVDGQVFHDVFGVVMGYTKIGDEYLAATMFSNRKKINCPVFVYNKKESAGTQPRHASFIPYVYVRNEGWGYRFFCK